MPIITLPNGAYRVFPFSLSAYDVAQDISPSLARSALAARVNDRLCDLSTVITEDVRLALITERDPEALDLLRHSCAHLMAMAVKQLYPEAQVTIGPTVEDGFYYDFAYSRPFTPEDLAQIEERMRELAHADLPIERSEVPREEAVRLFESLGETYKCEIIRDLPADAVVSLYRQGDFVDLCRGPHVSSTGKLKAFKLMKVAGAYWRGDSKNAMLQRIYGTAWTKKEDLDAYLMRIEEAEKRDHRKLGRELDLFHFQEEAPGLVFWHPKGWAIWQQVEQYMRRLYQASGYQEVKAPLLLDLSLWEKTGHWENYRENMFTTESENRYYALKPMNCPGHVLIYKSQMRSYRELPLRYGEFGTVHRNEASGALHGMLRVRGFTQDDGHIFCTEDQILEECANFTALLQKVYKDFGFTDIIYKVATRPEARIGSDEAWDKAENALMESLRRSGCHFEIAAGEGAFYGPKVEYTLKDALGRQWQCGTIQVDPNMPERLGAEYVDETGERRTPLMLHRAIVGSLERFIGILIEQHAGALPAWLAPVQAVVMNITDDQAGYAQEVAKTLQKQGLRVECDLRNEKITRKIREHSMQKVPFLLVVGDKEKANGAVAVRARGNQDLGVMPLADFQSKIANDIANRV